MLLSALLLLTPAAPAAPQDPPQPPPPPAAEEPGEITPEEAAATIKEALAGKDAARAAEVLGKFGLVEGEEVVREAAKGLAHKELPVRLAALQALRFNPDPEAIGLLLKQSRNKTLLDEDKTAAEYYLALGQKSDKRALKILTDGLRIDRGDRATAARIAAVGRIREKDSVEALMKLMVSGKGRRGNPHMQQIRTSLAVLTGEDYGGSETDWIGWWNDNKRSLKIAEKPPKLPLKLELEWTLLWAHPDKKEALRKKLKKGVRDAE